VPRKKGIYIGAPKCFALELACRQLWDAFDEDDAFFGCYVVGSAMERPDWRDVDVVGIMADAAFFKLFPGATIHDFEFNPRWLIITVALSRWLSDQSGLPVDFKFQAMTHANSMHHGPRSAIGLSKFKRAK